VVLYSVETFTRIGTLLQATEDSSVSNFEWVTPPDTSPTSSSSSPLSYLLLVFGGNSQVLYQLRLEKVHCQASVLHRWKPAEDFIWACAVAPLATNTSTGSSSWLLKLAACLAHNTVQVWELTLEKHDTQWQICTDSPPQCSQQHQCQDNSLLYCASFAPGWTGGDDLCLASGTVFGVIVVWYPFVDTSVSKRGAGHEGVLFDIVWNENATMLASVSDDRTIRTWHFDSGSDELEPLYVGFGHAARVWRCCFIPMFGNTTTLASVSEDCEVRIWDPSASNEATSRLCHHYGGVWSVAYDAKRHVLASGSEDFSIALQALGPRHFARLCSTGFDGPQGEIDHRVQWISIPTTKQRQDMKQQQQQQQQQESVAMDSELTAAATVVLQPVAKKRKTSEQNQQNNNNNNNNTNKKNKKNKKNKNKKKKEKSPRPVITRGTHVMDDWTIFMVSSENARVYRTRIAHDYVGPTVNQSVSSHQQFPADLDWVAAGPAFGEQKVLGCNIRGLSESTCAIGSANGTISIITDISSSNDVAVDDAKHPRSIVWRAHPVGITALRWYSLPLPPPHGAQHFLITCDAFGYICAWHVDLASDKFEMTPSRCIGTFALPYRGCTTGFDVMVHDTTSELSATNPLIVCCGDTYGSVFVASLWNDIQPVVSVAADKATRTAAMSYEHQKILHARNPPLGMLRKLHDTNIVHGVCIRRNVAEQRTALTALTATAPSDAYMVYSIGRNGNVCCSQLSLSPSIDSMCGSFEKLFSTTMPAFTRAVDIGFNKMGQMILYGFDANDFVCYCADTGVNIVRVPCDSWNREFDYASREPHTLSSGFAFLFSLNNFPAKNDAILVLHYSHGFTPLRHIRPAIHYKHINELMYVPAEQLPGVSDAILLTASDDQTMCIVQVQPDTESKQHQVLEYVPLSRLSQHPDPVRCMVLCDGMLYAGGRRELLQAFSVTFSSQRPYVACRYTTHVSQAHLHGFEKLAKDRGKLNIELRADDMLDLRIMSIAASAAAAPSVGHIVYTGISDGTLRIFSHKDSTFTVLYEDTEHAAPILCMSLVTLPAASLLVSGGTDGRIAVRHVSALHADHDQKQDLSISLHLSKERDLHQSGVNALDCITDPSTNQLLCFSGGDDQSLVVSHVTPASIEFVSRVSNAHTSAITSLKVVVASNSNAIYVLSTGYDQTVNLWQWSNSSQLSLVARYLSDVGDISSLDATYDANGTITISVAGYGMQSFTIHV
jgi:WD40 repeat protein